MIFSIRNLLLGLILHKARQYKWLPFGKQGLRLAINVTASNGSGSPELVRVNPKTLSLNADLR
jgi:hypothetical protein